MKERTLVAAIAFLCVLLTQGWAVKADKGKAQLTTADISKAITGFIKDDVKQRGGYFLIFDQETKKPLALSLTKVHEDRLAVVDKNLYFACVDMKTPEGKLYDVDFFLKRKPNAGLQVSEMTVHKEDGKARYSWVEEKGVWKRKK
ncbi:MAG: hypothetical protein HYU64_08950 [Armatimonadetes bacterium]|nr:hypothetical protein [Armatimonadota bacterium]